MKHLLKSLFVKVETTYKTNANPTTADVILAENVEIDPLQMQTDDYTPVSNKFGMGEKIVGAVWCSVQFDVVVGGGGMPVGAAGGVPNHDAVLRAGAMARVIVPGVNITYSPIDSAEESVSAVYHIDTARFAVLGLRGDLEWIFEAQKAPRMRFTGLGLRVPMTDGSSGAYTLPVRPRPYAMNNSNTQVVLDDVHLLRCSRLNVKLGNKVEYVNRVNQEEVLISDRQSAGSITFELPSVASVDFLGANGFCTLARQTVLFVRSGQSAPPGATVSWFFPEVQLFNPRLTGDKGTSMLTCDLHVIKNNMGVQYS